MLGFEFSQLMEKDLLEQRLLQKAGVSKMKDNFERVCEKITRNDINKWRRAGKGLIS
jgi:hypothetical protein